MPNRFLFFPAALFFSISFCFAQTETEPNNKFEQCNTLTFGSFITGTINKANDSDFFCIQVPNISVLNVAIDQVTGNAPITIHVFNPDKTYRAVYSGSAGGTINSSALACGPGTYYFMIFETSKTMAGPTYRLQLTTHAADQYECNNNFSTSTPISNTTPISASIDYDMDEDNYAVNITQEELLTVTVNPVPSNILMGLNLYDVNGNRLAQASSGWSGNKVSVSKQVQPGKYYIMLRSENISWSASAYTLTTTHAVITAVNENNQQSSIKLYPNPAKTDLFIQFDNAALFAYRRIQIYDAVGKLLYATDKPASTNSITIKTATFPAGTYRLQILGGKKVEVKQFVIEK